MVVEERSDRRWVAVIGGGVAGLSAALALRDLGVEIVLIERDRRLGGVVRTDVEGGFVLEGGPDSILSYKPAGIAMIDRLGLRDALVQTRLGGAGTFILHRGKLAPLPEGMTMLVPTQYRAIAATPLLSLPGKLRMLLDLVIPARRDDADESVGAFVRRRLGRQAFENLAEPLVSGIYSGDADQLSVLSTMPRLRQVEREHGGIVRGAIAQRRAGGPTGAPGPRLTPFVSLAGGMGQLVEAMGEALGASDIRLGMPVTGLTRDGDGYQLELAGGESLAADGVVLATPAPASAALLAPLAPELADELRAIPYGSSVSVALGYPEGALPVNAGRGFLVPRAEGRAIRAVTWSSEKFDGRAPAGQSLLRVVLGRPGEDWWRGASDDEIIARVRAELRAILGIDVEPTLARVYRWVDAMPQYVVGHTERVRRIDRLAETLPGLALTGSALRGVGIPDGIAAGAAAAQQVVARLEAARLAAV